MGLLGSFLRPKRLIEVFSFKSCIYILPTLYGLLGIPGIRYGAVHVK